MTSPCRYCRVRPGRRLPALSGPGASIDLGRVVAFCSIQCAARTAVARVVDVDRANAVERRAVAAVLAEPPFALVAERAVLDGRIDAAVRKATTGLVGGSSAGVAKGGA